MNFWKTREREISLERPLVMGILNVTPDSFSDGGRFMRTDAALRHVGSMIQSGADIIDIGGESTRPGSQQVSADDEIERLVPVITAIAARFDTPISVDTSKSEVARAAIDAGAEIINDISGLRFDKEVSIVAGNTGCGLILMHSIGEFATLHSTDKPENVVESVISGLQDSVSAALSAGVSSDAIALDVGVGFGKTPGQNLELILRHREIVSALEPFPFMIGTSRKSFIARLFGEREVGDRTGGSIVTALAAVRNGASIVRVHDVGNTVEALRAAAGLGLF